MKFKFNIKESNKLKGVWIIETDIAKDNRGDIWTSFLKREIDKLLPNQLTFIHDKFSKSKQNVLRGIHGDSKSWKLVTCVYGDIFQVVVDCRKESETYKLYESFHINESNQISILISPRMGNAFYVKSNIGVYHYKLAYEDNYIDADEQFSYRWNDPLFQIKWPSKSPILSERDK